MPDATEPCPVCREPVPSHLVKCPFCGAVLGSDLTPVRREGTIRLDSIPAAKKAMDALGPVITHPWAVVSSVLGLMAVIIPFCGFTFGFLAIVTGVLALRSIKRKPRAGGTKWAVIGIALGTLGVLLWGGFLLIWFLSAFRLAAG